MTTNDRDFVLDARLAADTVWLGESDLSCLLLMNERRYPWLILVPKRANVAEIYQLPRADQISLLDESSLIARVLCESFDAFKVNLGALGNIVRQLHVHHVARFAGDPAWPGPVWGHSPREPYASEALSTLVPRLQASALGGAFRFRA